MRVLIWAAARLDKAPRVCCGNYAVAKLAEFARSDVPAAYRHTQPAILSLSKDERAVGYRRASPPFDKLRVAKEAASMLIARCTIRMIRTAACLAVVSAAPAFGFPIRNYVIAMDVQPDSSVLVTETVVADFTGDPHHGIFREIPLSGKDKYGNKYRIRHQILQVTNAQGLPLQTSITKSGGRVRIRIGDPDVYVQDVRVYVIRYRLLRAVHFFREHDELYWNAVGHEWEVPIEQATCIVTLPSEAGGKDQIRTVAYTGFYGSTGSDALTGVPNTRTARFWMTRPLSPGEGMTIVVGWPKGIVSRPKLEQEARWFMADNGYFFLPPVFLLLLFGLWTRAGRDPDTGRSEMVAYDPPEGLRPAEIGTLIDERADIRDIAATIIDLAVRGYIRIRAETEKGFLVTKTDYLLELTRPYEEASNDMTLTAFERALVRALFSSGESRWVSSLSGHFYVHLAALRDVLYSSLVRGGYFTHSPDSVRSSYRAGGIALIVAGVLSAIFLGTATVVSVGWSIAVAVCGVMLAIAARTMPRKTAKGKNALLSARGFEEYLSRAERQEIEMQERQNYFEKFLPYAMALGIAHRWARAFEGIQTKPPDWFTGYDGGFRPGLFASDLDAASRNWGSAMAAQPRSSGEGGSSFFGGGSGFSGGSSGGGGGGGGGGGW